MISAKAMRDVLNYDPSSGVFTWKVKISKKVVVGRRAGAINSDGYRQISIFGRRYYAHRLAWLYVTGEWPPVLIDHENLNRDDNRWANLRSATKSQNAANTNKSSSNATGFKGVSWHDGAGKYQAHICVNGRGVYLGVFDAIQSAHEAYERAANDQFKNFARA
ncbi:HNH endonuclease signature motif containing protein [Mesorhizobium sp. LSHC414A00]|uniref:HNH endonuclease signature motif containing protein n=1 Tax=Mesorhizobium sp. LSHC414A00 TaxID=1287287 RepID=UPI0004CEFCBE|nr:HNH endonuclease signature motif containing protein [Mesorhizobium sp. LSHC414A00]